MKKEPIFVKKGMRIGRLKLLKAFYNSDDEIHINCICDCGKKVTKSLITLQEPRISFPHSCGCKIGDKQRESRVYLLRCSSKKEVYYKIGISKNAKERVKAIQAANPFPIKVIATKKGGEQEERKLHKKYKKYHHKLEWFKFNADILKQVIEEFKY
jgi:hypothetical protein